MAEVALEADAGRPTGSAAARRLRAAGKVPAVLYGRGIEPQAIAVDRRDLRAALAHEAGLNALFALQVGADHHLAMARQLQRDPIRGNVSHVDFVIVRRDEVVGVDVPVRLVGVAEAVEKADGLVEQLVFDLHVRAVPADIPSHIEVDVSAMAVGDAVRVSDLRLPAGVTTDLDPEEPVVIGQASKLTLAAEEAEAEEARAEEAAAEEPATGEAGEGAEASEGGSDSSEG